jgi:hypothetical protein
MSLSRRKFLGLSALTIAGGALGTSLYEPSPDNSRTNAHSQKGRKTWGSGAGEFQAFDTLSFLIEAQNMLQRPVLTGFYAF